MINLESSPVTAKSSMLSVKELVDLFTTSPIEQTEPFDDNLFGNPQSQHSSDDEVVEVHFVPIGREDAHDSFWLKPPPRNHSHSPPLHNFCLSEAQNDRRIGQTKSILKRGMPLSPTENKSVHWGANSIFSIKNSEKQAGITKVERKRKRSHSDSVLGSSKKPELAIPTDGQSPKKREKSNHPDSKCQCSIF